MYTNWATKKYMVWPFLLSLNPHTVARRGESRYLSITNPGVESYLVNPGRVAMLSVARTTSVKVQKQFTVLCQHPECGPAGISQPVESYCFCLWALPTIETLIKTQAQFYFSVNAITPAYSVSTASIASIDSIASTTSATFATVHAKTKFGACHHNTLGSAFCHRGYNICASYCFGAYNEILISD